MKRRLPLVARADLPI